MENILNIAYFGKMEDLIAIIVQNTILIIISIKEELFHPVRTYIRINYIQKNLMKKLSEIKYWIKIKIFWDKYALIVALLEILLNIGKNRRDIY